MCDPFRVVGRWGHPTVGGGHKKRALAHGYSAEPLRGSFDVNFTHGVQPKVWVKISPREGVCAALGEKAVGPHQGGGSRLNESTKPHLN